MIDTLGYYLTHPDAVIYEVATALLYPVLIAEVIALLIVIFEAGRFTVEALGRVRKRSLGTIRTSGQSARDALADGKTEDALGHLGTALAHGRYGRRFVSLLSADTTSRTEFLKLLNDVELEAARRLERTRMLIRIGPMLGLMGTLIPISPALVGLAQGDVQTLSDNLVIAFSTTVVGLLIGGVAYAVSAIRDRLYTQDVSDIEYVLDLLEV
ncbi:MAG: MotA/TolQ/ExbB proton channel family protein [Coriobacteriia bacterium]|nr:MotA/TolQ/ExbB proton channel family protein [Coriobacteriia bacterium]